jgi:hypothetical protein
VPQHSEWRRSVRARVGIRNGFFILTGPNSLWRESATKTWYGGGDYGTTANFGGNFPAVVGQYCVTFYQALSKEDVEQGRACESIE